MFLCTKLDKSCGFVHRSTIASNLSLHRVPIAPSLLGVTAPAWRIAQQTRCHVLLQGNLTREPLEKFEGLTAETRSETKGNIDQKKLAHKGARPMWALYYSLSWFKYSGVVIPFLSLPLTSSGDRTERELPARW